MHMASVIQSPVIGPFFKLFLFLFSTPETSETALQD